MLRNRGCWWPKSPKSSPKSSNCHHHISSPTSVTNIDVARLECSSSLFACMLSESLIVVGFMLESRMLSWKFHIKFFQLHSDLSKLNGNFPTSKLPSKKFPTSFSKYTFNDMAALVPLFIVCICLQFACNLLAICFQSACNLLAIGLQFACNLLAAAVAADCNAI